MFRNVAFQPLCGNIQQLLAGIFNVGLCSLSFALSEKLCFWLYAVIARLGSIYFIRLSGCIQF